MRVIHKFPLQVFGFDYGEMEVPRGEVVLIDFQHGILTAWVDRQLFRTGEVDDSTMNLVIVPTGVSFDAKGLLHVGSACGPEYVWHVYRRVQ